MTESNKWYILFYFIFDQTYIKKKDVVF